MKGKYLKKKRLTLSIFTIINNNEHVLPRVRLKPDTYQIWTNALTIRLTLPLV